MLVLRPYSLLALCCLTTQHASAFSVSRSFLLTTSRQPQRQFVSRQVALSDLSDDTSTDVSVNAAASEDASEGSLPAEPIEIPATDAGLEEAMSAAAEGQDENSAEPEEKERHSIYVGNLPYGTTLEEVREIFAEHVDVGFINLPRNEATGEIKGFAFVDVASEDQIAQAVEALNEKKVADRPLRVSKVLPKGQIRSRRPKETDKNKLFVGNLPFKATAEDVKGTLGQFGEITDVFIPVDPLGEPRGFGFVTCAEGATDAVMESGDGVELMGRRLTVNRPLAPGEKSGRKVQQSRPTKRKLYVGNLSFFTTEDTLSAVFEEFGTVYDVYIPRDVERDTSRGFGFVTMDDGPGMDAIDGLDGCEIDGRIIGVNEAMDRRKVPRQYEREEEDSESP